MYCLDLSLSELRLSIQNLFFIDWKLESLICLSLIREFNAPLEFF